MLVRLRHQALALIGCMVLLLAVAACGETQPPTPTPSPADEHIAKGKDHNRKGDYRKAIESYDEAIRLNPQDAIAYNSRGNAYAGLGQYERAIPGKSRIMPAIGNVFPSDLGVVKEKQSWTLE